MTAPDQPAEAPSAAERIAEITKRLAAATPGPWRQDVMYVDAVVPQGRPGGEVIIQCYPTVRHLNAVVPVKANAAFVAHSREDVPWLLSHIDRLTAERDDARADRDHWQKLATNHAQERDSFRRTLGELLGIHPARIVPNPLAAPDRSDREASGE